MSLTQSWATCLGIIAAKSSVLCWAGWAFRGAGATCSSWAAAGARSGLGQAACGLESLALCRLTLEAVGVRDLLSS